MRYGEVGELNVYDCGRKYEGETVRVSVEFQIDRKVLFEFMDALRPIYPNAPREPIAAILDHSAKPGIEVDE